MKNILWFLATILVFVKTVDAQSLKSKTYSSGIYIFCGNELPKKFSYIIERKMPANADWITVAAIKAPAGEADCQGRLMSLPSSMADFTHIEAVQVTRFWERCRTSGVLDSLYAYAFDPRYQFAAGCAWFDEGLTRPGVYQYRISKKDKADSMSLLKEERITFPSKTYAGTLSVLRFKPDERGVIIHYSLTDTINTAGIKLYRSKHLENNFTEVESRAFFTLVNKTTIGQVVDATAVQGITYSYTAIPYDALGNTGTPGDTLVVYNNSKPAAIGVVQRFEVKPSEEKQGMDLLWKLQSNVYISSIEVYRSAAYDGIYQKIASIPAKQTTYFDDHGLEPATSYFYYIVANAAYGRSYPGARVPAILKGSKANIIAPQQLAVARKGNVVTLSFTKAEPDTRGYYVYRANGHTGALQQLPRMLLSTDSAVVYKDTLPFSNLPQVYAYAVADVNTSYNISPVSERISVQTSGSVLPVPDGVAAMLLNNTVFVTWKNPGKRITAISGYKIVRSTVDDEGQETTATAFARVGWNAHSYTDTAITDGIRYRYQVQSIGIEEADTSSLSRWASIAIPAQQPLQPGRVLAYAADKKALIKWDMPADTSVIKTRVYRALAGQQPQLLKEMNNTVYQFEDTSLELNKTYYYIITTVNKKNRESKPTDAVAVKISE
jgi:fibronectin type 3 domain-containing protein